jgi:hypothetical protein
VDDEKRTPSPEEQAKKAERRKILERLNTMDTGVSRYDMEQEEQRARGIDIAREKQRRPDPGGASIGGSGWKRDNYSDPVLGFREHLHPNFRESDKHEVRRIPVLRTWVNRTGPSLVLPESLRERSSRSERLARQDRREGWEEMETLLSIPTGLLGGLQAQSEIGELLDELYYDGLI